MRKPQLTSVVRLWLPPILWAVLIFTISSIETIKVTDFIIWDFILKKSAHVIEFAILFILVFRATNRNWLLAYLLAFAYAISDEYHQSFVAGRTASILDLGFDASGANIASYIIWKLKPRWTWLRLNRKKKPKK